jgi:hypothetical protein
VDDRVQLEREYTEDGWVLWPCSIWMPATHMLFLTLPECKRRQNRSLPNCPYGKSHRTNWRAPGSTPLVPTQILITLPLPS